MIIKLDTKSFYFPFGLRTFYLHDQFIPYFVLIPFETFQGVRLMLNHINTITYAEVVSKYDVVVFPVPCGKSDGSTHISVYKIQ